MATSLCLEGAMRAVVVAVLRSPHDIMHGSAPAPRMARTVRTPVTIVTETTTQLLFQVHTRASVSVGND
jgi:hypothetical protein